MPVDDRDEFVESLSGRANDINKPNSSRAVLQIWGSWIGLRILSRVVLEVVSRAGSCCWLWRLTSESNRPSLSTWRLTATQDAGHKRHEYRTICVFIADSLRLGVDKSWTRATTIKLLFQGDFKLEWDCCFDPIRILVSSSACYLYIGRNEFAYDLWFVLEFGAPIWWHHVATCKRRAFLLRAFTGNSFYACAMDTDEEQKHTNYHR